MVRIFPNEKIGFESVFMLLSQNPGSRGVLMANFQLSLEQINLHLKDKFWYQVELGEESAMMT